MEKSLSTQDYEFKFSSSFLGIVAFTTTSMRPSQTSDELIRRWQQGDPTAFAEIVAQWQQPIVRFLARLIGSALAPDLAQEVFLKLYRSVGNYRDQGYFKAWLYRIALNVVRDHQRRAEARPKLHPWSDHDQIDGIESMGQTMVRVELQQAVEYALIMLPETQRETLVLRHYEQLTFEDMARLLETPVTTLKSRFSAALLRIKTELMQQGWGVEDLS